MALEEFSNQIAHSPPEQGALDDLEVSPVHRLHHTQSLSSSLLRADEAEYAEVAEVLQRLESEEGGEHDLFSAIRPFAGQVVGRGQEAICFQLAPTSSFLDNQGFRAEVSELLYNRDNIRHKILSDLQQEEERINYSQLSTNEQIHLALESFPEKLVVKIVRPDGGAWDSSWGVREFDAPTYIWRELTDGYYLVVQEELATIRSLDVLENQLGPEYKIVDPVGTLQDPETSLGTGQCGFNRFGKIALFDYSAITLTDGYTDTLLRVVSSGAAYVPHLKGRSPHSSRHTHSHNESGGQGAESSDGHVIDRQLRALSKEQGFWADKLNRTVMEGILSESIDNQLPDSDSLTSLSQFVALKQYPKLPFNEAVNRATKRVNAVVERAVQEKLFQ